MFFSGCVTGPKDFKTLKQGQWEARALIKDKVNSKTYVAILNIYAIRDKSLRFDLVSPLGDHLGTLIVNEDKVTLLNVGSRMAYTGKASRSSKLPLINIPIEPENLQAVVFNMPMSGAGWDCQYNDTVVSECLNKKTKLKVEWDRRSDGKRTVTLEHKTGSMQINFKKFQNNLDDNVRFALKIPKSFNRQSL